MFCSLKHISNSILLYSHVKGIVTRCKANHDRYQELVLETDTSVDKQYADLRKGNTLLIISYFYILLIECFCSYCEGYS